MENMSVCKTASVARESARHGGQPSLQGPQEAAAGGGHALPTPGREQLPRIPHQTWGWGAAQGLDNMLASNPGRHL